MDAVDTPPDVTHRVRSIFAAMSGPKRVPLATEMADEAKLIAVAGIRARHPELSDDDVASEWLRLLHGDEIAEVACSSTS